MKAKLIAAICAALFASTALIPQTYADDLKLPKGLRGDGKITLYRPVKNDTETFQYRNDDGTYSEKAMEAIAHFFRCRLTDEEQTIDPGLIEILDAVEDHFDAKQVKLISAYRSPTRNNIMSSRNRKVARESYHTKGMAADIEIDGISARAIRDFAYLLNQGGIGYYSNRSFVHVDTGPQRTWGFKPNPARMRTAPATSHK